jgi:hypothetical protein
MDARGVCRLHPELARVIAATLTVTTVIPGSVAFLSPIHLH